LKRELGLFQTTLIGVGIIFGAGIYALLGKAAGLAGNEVWLAFLLGAFIATFSGLSYAELSSMFPKAGAEYVYTRKAFNKKIAFLTGWLIIIAGIIASATVALGFGGYFAALFGTPVVAVAAALIILCSIINFWGIKESVTVGVLFTIIEALGLLIIIFVGIPFLGSIDYFENPFGLTGILQATALIFFAYIGFEEITRLAEETKNPKKIIPKALIGALLISTFVYVLVGVVATSVIDWQTLSHSSAPLADVARAAGGNDLGTLLAVIALFATANTVLLIMLATSRMAYGMAGDSPLPAWLGLIHYKNHTPMNAIAIITVGTILLVLPGDIGFAANATDFLLFTTFVIINAAVIWLRIKKPNIVRGFRAPLNVFNIPIVSVIGLLTALFMLTTFESQISILGIAIITIGVLMYEPLKKRKEEA
jgi:APA family basic amino acid/polyamine antiporter